MSNRIQHHKYAWKCPSCGNYKRVKCSLHNTRIANCCDNAVEVTTHIVERMISELQITDFGAMHIIAHDIQHELREIEDD